ncbi:signal peptidase II Aspartic peptidase. MEROPS family A08 [Litoreibacter albidus]|uniref:Lipoprotein signal peptidase n=2 Tax=Litoreibacter albidus TaxID=670155 RepID=A0A1H3C6U4_9RHOB|nr:signal peptidase II [Litoreibacter albidus]SDX49826.1 signal peptidase II Aspartic peptidase. MEROPS family A08 [Litoreibacter albidus]
MRVMLLTALAAFGIDQLSKWAVVHKLNLIEVRSIDVLPPLLNFRMGWNTGINFGLLSDNPEFMRVALVVFAIVVSGFLLWWGNRNLGRVITRMGAGAIIGGALANALDRVIYGAVADFLNISCCGINNPYTFNIADIFIFAGAFALVAFDDTKGEQAAG